MMSGEGSCSFMFRNSFVRYLIWAWSWVGATLTYPFCHVSAGRFQAFVVFFLVAGFVFSCYDMEIFWFVNGNDALIPVAVENKTVRRVVGLFGVFWLPGVYQPDVSEQIVHNKVAYVVLFACLVKVSCFDDLSPLSSMPIGSPERPRNEPAGLD